MDFITDLPKSAGYDSILTVVDRHSRAIILSPCHKTITAEQTSQLLVDNIWKRTGFPKAIISDQGPQFAAQVTQKLWRKLGIKQKLSTTFHPQTDGESERVNQEIEQYLCICGNFQQDDWASLLPIIEFAHNACYDPDSRGPLFLLSLAPSILFSHALTPTPLFLPLPMLYLPFVVSFPPSQETCHSW